MSTDSAPGATLPVLDPRTIRELRAVGARLAEDVLSEAVGAFEKTAPALVRMLAHASQAGDMARLARLALSLRSASAQVGAARLAHVAGRLARDANASAPGVGRLVGVCARELHEVRLVLAKLTEHEV